MSSFPGGPTLQVKGQIFTDLTNIIKLKAYCTNTNSSTFVKAGSTAGYQVTAGKVLVIYAIEYMSTNANSSATVLYADTDLGFNGSTGSIVTPVYNYGSSAAAGIYAGAAYEYRQLDYEMRVPAAKYLTVNNQTGSSVNLFTAYAYEVAP